MLIWMAIHLSTWYFKESNMIDLGQYDAVKKPPSDDDGIHTRFRERVRQWQLEEDEREAQALRSSFAIDNSNNS
jgi:hypothetical protein